jgi:tetratricopeptide (TPR) repeat protein
MVRHRVPALLAAAIVLAGAPAAAAAAADADHAGALRSALVEADRRSQAGEVERAESSYRAALLEGWLLMGALHLEAGDLAAARAALLRASTAAVETRRALTALAVVHMQLGEHGEAIAALRTVAARHKGDLQTRRLLAQALVAAGQPEQAVQELEEIRALAPDDPEVGFTLASGYLRVGKIEQAERLFAAVVAARPLAQTHVLIGRTYRDFDQPQRAAAAFADALRIDPRARRAHYYLGTLALLDKDGPRVDEAIGELQRELAVYPDDQAAKLYLGMALVEAKRFAEALPSLVDLARGERATVEALFYLGRCLLGLGRPRDAVEPLRRALLAAPAQHADGVRVQGIQYQLALALRRAGDESAAATYFAAAEKLSAELAQASKDRLARYLSNVPEPEEQAALALSAFAVTSLEGIEPAQRAELQRDVESALARSYFNLAVMRLQAAELPRALELLAAAEELAPELPGLQRALGVAYFNDRRYGAAIPPLTGALGRQPDDAELRRLLALAHLESGGHAKAAELLASDAQRSGDPALQYAYALALVRSGQAAAAEQVFAQLLREHARWPELHVLLGQAHAGQSDFDAAIAALQRALALSPTVAEAQLTLGTIYLRQGRLGDAEQALRAELAHHPDNVQARHQLATVLDLQGKAEEAIPLLVALLAEAPRFANGRYLLGKMLLARGEVERAAAELRTAAELSPQDANIHYQLGQAYQKLGQPELARQQFDLYRELKQGSRGGES